MWVVVLLLKYRWVGQTIPFALALEDTASEEYSTARFGCLELDGGVEMTLAVGAKSGPMRSLRGF
jgi:hypothetical protein